MKVRWGHLFACVWSGAGAGRASQSAPPASLRRCRRLARHVEPPSQAFVNTYCATCHNQRLKTGGLALDTLDVARTSARTPRSGRRSSSSCAPA